MNHKEETLSSKQIYQGRILSVYDDTVLLENGHEAKREWVDHNGGVCILTLDADGCTYLVRQYRYPYHQEILELLRNLDHLVIFYTPMGMEVGLNLYEVVLYMTYSDYERFLKLY